MIQRTQNPIGDRVRRLREAANLSRDVAAERGGISTNFWARLSARESTSFETILGIAKGLQFLPPRFLPTKRKIPTFSRRPSNLQRKPRLINLCFYTEWQGDCWLDHVDGIDQIWLS